MKATELFTHKLDIMFKEVDKDEQRFIDNFIYKFYNPEDGFDAEELKVLIMEIYGFQGRIFGIETLDSQKNLHVFNFEKYQKFYTNDWVVNAFDDIQELGKGSRSHLYFTFPRQVIRKHLKNAG